ncbi:SRPBCC family protein [Streptomyces fuscigenes]|uniref:SRPBCC family protein n=1 Tax=Streptomyces fuscigenes TaxID=1528880 RepID=UPI001F48B920|nr:SRPBCC family protein [Streptomyces fuscigenes]MCF3960225.1 SRPBCC family protein [Streptomyces fuscigenes]
MTGTGQNPSVMGELAVRLLREEGSRAFDSAVGRLAEGASGTVTRVTGRLTEVAENDGRLAAPGPTAGIGEVSTVATLVGLHEASLKGLAAGKAKDFLKGIAKDAVTGKVKDAAKGMAKDAAKDFAVGKVKDVTDKVTDAAQGLTGSGSEGKAGNTKVTSVIEVMDIGVPLRTVYDFWTQYEEFGDFAKGVQSVDRDDDVTSKWKVKIAFSNRSFEATVQEQVPDDRIVWRSEGSKGSTNGAVSFHELAPSLTRVVTVIEYYPSGFFEKTGNLWRAQGRRMRLDLKHFQRYVTLTDEEPEGWRGEIRDGEVVRTDEEVRDAESADDEDSEDEDGADDDYRDEDEEYEEDTDNEDDEDEDEGEKAAAR